MEDDNNLQAAASLPAAVPVPVEDERRPLLAMLVDVEKPPASSPPIAGPSMILLMVVFLWVMINAVGFASLNIARLILSFMNGPCNKPTWIVHCVTLTDAADTAVSYLQYGEELCSAAVAVAMAAAVHMLQKRTTTTTTTSHRAAAVVILLFWVALGATVGIHGMYVASAYIVIASDPGNTVHFAFGYVCLTLDLVVAVLLCCCSPRRGLEQLGEHQGGNI